MSIRTSVRTSLRRTLALSAVALSALSSFNAHAQADPFLGQITCFGFNFAPRGWMLAQGQLLPISQNQALFSLLGTTYGGNGQTTFALPNLQGRVVIGAGQAPGLTPHTLGEMGGTETTTLTVNQLPAHTHTVAPVGSTADASSISPAGKAPASKARTTLYADATPGTNLAASVSSSVGGGQPVPIVQPYVALNCAIAVQGIFPARD